MLIMASLLYDKVSNKDKLACPLFNLSVLSIRINC